MLFEPPITIFNEKNIFNANETSRAEYYRGRKCRVPRELLKQRLKAAREANCYLRKRVQKLSAQKSMLQQELRLLRKETKRKMESFRKELLHVLDK